MKQRTITAFFFAAIMLGGIYWNKYSFQFLFTAIAGVMLWEFFGLIFKDKRQSHQFEKVTGLLAGIIPVLFFGFQTIHSNFWWCGTDPPPDPVAQHLHNQFQVAGDLFILLGLFTMLAFTAAMFRQRESPASIIGYYLLGLFYIGFPIMTLFSLAMPDAIYTPNRVFGLLWLIWTNDTIAYLVGSRFGKRKLYERISPKKTWEGTLGGAAGTVLMAWGLSHWFPDYNPAQWLVLGIIVALLATPGDLVESMLKRNAGVKDSGKIMPGHGGLLDRFDSLVFVLPFAWLAVIVLGG